MEKRVRGTGTTTAFRGIDSVGDGDIDCVGDIDGRSDGGGPG